MVSPPEVWPPSSAYKLQPPLENGGGGNDEAPGAAGGRASGGQSCSGPSGGAVARERGSLGWWRWAGGDSAAAGGRHAGPLGLHLVTLAPPSPAPAAGLGLKERRRSLRSSGPAGAGQDRTAEGQREAGAGEERAAICYVLRRGSRRPPCLPRRWWVTGDRGVRGAAQRSTERAGANMCHC